MPSRLVDRRPEVEPDALVAAMVPPPRFAPVRFDTYRPDPAEPSQAAAVDTARAFAERVRRGRTPTRWWRREEPAGPTGLYFDGGFGVGKTHLLASLWHEVDGPRAYGTFVELTHLVGALGFAEAVRRLSSHRLLAVDEFELDDPGDTTLVGRLLAELDEAGVFLAATSNTLPDRLGEGRFAAEDFSRELRALADRFTVARIDGPDYRHRGLPDAPAPLADAELVGLAERTDGATLDDFAELTAHLAALHPSRYGRLVEGVAAVHVRGLHPAPDQDVALRLVVLADRLYDADVPVRVSGAPVSALFGEDMLRGGYRKKYLRAVSRLTALARAGAA